MDEIQKNPISILQEYAASQLKVFPNYTVIVEKKGPHLNSFEVRVEFNDNTAVGHGNSKKEAKVNAALKMLNLLYLSPTKFQKSVKSLNTSIGSSSNITNTNINISSNPVSPNLNYIGKLQETGTMQNIFPEYFTKAMYGQPHNMEFVIVCKYNGLEEEGKGKTKKEAKMLSAKKMYDRLCIENIISLPKFDLDQTISKKMSELKIMDISNFITESSNKALAYFPKVSKTVPSETVNENPHCISEYHSFFKNSFNLLDRKSAIDKLKIIINDSKNSIFSPDKDIHPVLLLEAVLKDLNINFVIKSTINTKINLFLYNLVLKTNPSISEFGYGKNKDNAKSSAVYQMASTLSLLLL